MLNIRIICVGRFKEKYWEAASAEYIKRLGVFCSISVTEIKEEKLPANASAADERSVIEAESRAILSKVSKNDYVVALDVKGKELSSEEISKKIEQTAFTHSTIDFIIGGSLGFGDEVRSRADLRLSFGKITLPHQLARVVLLEQIYRAFMISSGATYHK